MEVSDDLGIHDEPPRRRRHWARLVIVGLLVVAWIATTVVQRHAAVPDFRYHGGQLLAQPSVHLVYWLPPGFHYERGRSGDAGFMRLTERYVRSVGGSGYLGVLRQYSHGRNRITGRIRYGGAEVDRTDAMPFKPTAKHPLLDRDLIVPVEHSTWVMGWRHTGSHADRLFILFLPRHLHFCRFKSRRDCNFQAHPTTKIACAFHTYFLDFGPVAVIDDTGYMEQCNHYLDGNLHGDRIAANAVVSTNHEVVEAITDPYLNGWYRPGEEGEVADLCADDGFPEVDLHGQRFSLGRVWSARDSDCVDG